MKKVDQLWVQLSRRGGSRLTINRRHPLVVQVLANSGPMRRDVTDLLAILEQTIPVLLLPGEATEELPLEERTPEDILRLAERVYEGLLATGLSRNEARQRVRHTEPFHLYPSLMDQLEGTK
jgi:hypothetical protein